MGTVIQDQQQRNPESQPRWDRFERADLFEQYRELRTQCISERQAAKELKVPRTTLQAWRMWHDGLDICPHVAEFFQSGPGLVPHPLLILGYSRFNFVRASSILHCQSTPRCLALVLSAQIPISDWSKGSSPMRRSVRH